MSKTFKSTVSHSYIAMLAVTFVMTLLDSKNWWLLVLTYLTMKVVANLIEKEDVKVNRNEQV